MTVRSASGASTPRSMLSRRRHRARVRDAPLQRSAWNLLLIVQLFNAVSAIGGGAALIFANGLGMPSSMLAATPFAHFVIPGVILALVVGGTQCLAVATQWAGSRWYLVAASVAGMGMIIWIYVEVAMLPGYSFLHTLYLGTGVSQLVLVFLLLGGWPGTKGPTAVERGREA